MNYPPPKQNSIKRLALWGWKAYLVYLALGALFILVLFVIDGALWAIPLFAFFGYVAYVQIRNRRRVREDVNALGRSQRREPPP